MALNVNGLTVDRIVIGVVFEDVGKGKVLVVEEHVPHVRVHARIEYHDLFRPTGRGDSPDTWKCPMFPAIVLFFISSCGQ